MWTYMCTVYEKLYYEKLYWYVYIGIRDYAVINKNIFMHERHLIFY